jgi:predicted porin
MKKSLIALAVASAVSAPAFAATSNVDVYGRLNMAVSIIDDQPSTTSDLQFSSFGSRLGFKGSEDLGGGLKAIWQIESGINPDEQNGTLASRNSFVGLAGDWGTALIGNHDTPLKLVGRAVDLFGDTIGDSRNVMGGGSDARADNVVAYISPTFSGFHVAAAFSTDPFSAATAAGDVDDRTVYNLAAIYSNGPVYLGFAYGDGDGHEAAGVGSHWRAAGAFTMGDFKIVGQYDNLEDNNGIAPAAFAGDYDAWMVGGAFTMGNFVLKANYMDGSQDNTTADPSQWTIGADYNLSKRTTVYALYTAGEYISLGGGAGASDVIGSCATCGGDVSGLSFGVAHNF